jgi:acyl-CoA thioester hydrolase
MPRLRDEEARLRLGSYPRKVEIRATYADVDSFQHLNNVALARFFEEGRAAMNMELFGVDTVVRPSEGVQLLFASIAIEYLAQGQYPGSVTVATGVSSVGRSSFTQSAAIFQGETCLAVCEAVTVYGVDGRGQPLPDSVRASLPEFAFAR